jgi:hypothetical protein
MAAIYTTEMDMSRSVDGRMYIAGIRKMSAVRAARAKLGSDATERVIGRELRFWQRQPA